MVVTLVGSGLFFFYKTIEWLDWCAVMSLWQFLRVGSIKNVLEAYRFDYLQRAMDAGDFVDYNFTRIQIQHRIHLGQDKHQQPRCKLLSFDQCNDIQKVTECLCQKLSLRIHRNIADCKGHWLVTICLLDRLVSQK